MEFDGKLADACRIVLKNVGQKSLTPTEVRDAVKALGYDLSKHTNQMAAVHSVLKRLKDAGEVDTKEWKQAPGQRRYYWLTKPDNRTISVEAAVAGMEAANQVIRQHVAAMNRMRSAMATT